MTDHKQAKRPSSPFFFKVVKKQLIAVVFTVHAFADYDGDDTSDCIYYIPNIIILEKPDVEDDDVEDDDAFIFALLE